MTRLKHETNLLTEQHNTTLQFGINSKIFLKYQTNLLIQQHKFTIYYMWHDLS